MKKAAPAPFRRLPPILLILSLIPLIAAFAAGARAAAPAAPAATAQPAAPAASPASPVPAMVDGEPVTAREVERELKGITARHQRQWKSPDEIRRAALDKLVDNLLVVRQARRDGLTRSEDYLLKEKAVLNPMLAELYLARNVDAAAAPSASDVAARLPRDWTRVRAMILYFPEAAEAEQAAKALGSGRGKPEDYQGKGGVKGGEKTGLMKGSTDFDPATENIIFSLKQGETSGAIPSPVGYLVITVRERQTLSPDEQENLRKQTAETIRLERVSFGREALLRRLRAEHRLKLDSAFLASVGSRKEDPAAYDGLPVGTFDDVTVRMKQVRFAWEFLRQKQPDAVVPLGPLAEQMVVHELLARLAEAQGLGDTEDVRASRKAVEGELIIGMVREQLQRGIAVGDAEVETYYRERTAEFKSADEATIRYLWTDSPEKAREAAKRVKAGDDFGALIREYSLDPSDQAGGAYKPVRRGMVDNAFFQAAWAIPEGGVSDPVNALGYTFIIQTQAKTRGRQREFSEVAAGLKEKLLKDKQQTAVQNYLAGLRKNAKIVVDDEALKKITVPEPKSLEGGMMGSHPMKK